MAARAGTVTSEVVLGGRKVEIRRLRVRGDGEEVALPTFQAFADTDPLNRRVVEQMLVGVATRQDGRSLEPTGADVRTRGTSKSAVEPPVCGVRRRRHHKPLLLTEGRTPHIGAMGAPPEDRAAAGTAVADGARLRGRSHEPGGRGAPARVEQQPCAQRFAPNQTSIRSRTRLLRTTALLTSAHSTTAPAASDTTKA